MTYLRYVNPPTRDEVPVTGLRDQQRLETRRRLLEVAWALFSSEGYAHVSLKDVVSVAEVTKGALYHHFGSKVELFAEVVQMAHREVAEEVETSAEEAGDDPWQAFLAGCEAFVAACTDERRRRLMLLDGPVVLGWSRWREMDDAGAGASLRAGLDELMDGGLLRPLPVEALTRLLSGAMNDAALWVADGDGQSRLADAHSALRALLEGLRPGP